MQTPKCRVPGCRAKVERYHWLCRAHELEGMEDIYPLVKRKPGRPAKEVTSGR
jgi:hypothetical protein